MKNKLYYPLIIFFLTTLFSCTKEKETTVETENFKGIFIVNEGAYGQSNGSVGLYKPGEKKYFNAFTQANGRPLGDVVQSMNLIGNKFFIAVNNSNRVEVVNASDFKSVASISTISPRYIVPVNQTKAYLSNLYSNTLKIVDLVSNSVSGSIDIHHGSDKMLFAGGNMYITTFENKLMVVNADADQLTDSIELSGGLTTVVSGSSGTIAALCTGTIDWNTGNVLEKGKIHIIATDSLQIEKTTELTVAGYGGSMIFSPSDGNFYFSLGSNVVQKMDAAGNVSTWLSLPAGASVYGLSIDAVNNTVYVMNSPDFSSAGTVIAFDLSGNKIFEFQAGIAPNSAIFHN